MCILCICKLYVSSSETVIYLHLNYHDETKALAKDIQRWVAILEYNEFFFFQEK